MFKTQVEHKKERIQENMDNNVFSCGIFLDFKKAFDTVDNSVLLHKLHHYGGRGTVHNWFISYLEQPNSDDSN